MNALYKQAIYDRAGKVAFYEVFIQDISTGKYPQGLDPLKATTMAIDILVELNPARVGNGKLLFVNVPAIFLEASMFDLLSPEYIGIELVENKRLTNQLLSSIKTLLKKNFKFSIDDFGFEKIDYLPLLGKCHYVKIDFKSNPYDTEELKEVLSILKSLRKGIIAKNIETKEDYESAHKLGFTHYQGLYLSKPVKVKDTRTISYLKETILKLYKAIKKKDSKGVVDILEKDIGATYKFLKLINSVYFPKMRNIKSIDEAVARFGLDNIAKFTIVLALSEMFAQDYEAKLWEKALFRASLAERLSNIYAPQHIEKAYLVGLLSLADEVLGQRPEEVARDLMLDRDIIEAFEKRLNELGFILSLVELVEDNREDKIINKVSRILSIGPEDVKRVIREAEKDASQLFVSMD